MNPNYLLVNFLLTFTTSLSSGISLNKSVLIGLSSLLGALSKLIPQPPSNLTVDNEKRISNLEENSKK